MSCKKVYSLKYDYRSSPPYKANKCKNTRKKGNDGIMYISKKDKNGVYRWKRSNKTLKKNKTITMKDLQRMAKQYHITKNGSKKQLAKRILLLRKHLISKKNKKILDEILSS